jgi:hypothetical protein
MYREYVHFLLIQQLEIKQRVPVQFTTFSKDLLALLVTPGRVKIHLYAPGDHSAQLVHQPFLASVHKGIIVHQVQVIQFRVQLEHIAQLVQIFLGYVIQGTTALLYHLFKESVLLAIIVHREREYNFRV